MYEHRKQPLAPKNIYLLRMLKQFVKGVLILLGSLLLGILGYHYSANISWLDSLHNASMILSGMGPVVKINTTTGKWFSSAYALFSGIVFVTSIGVILAPAVHRFFHRLHMEK